MGSGDLADEILKCRQLAARGGELAVASVDFSNLAAEHAPVVVVGLVAAVSRGEDLSEPVEGDVETVRGLDEGESLESLPVIEAIAGRGASAGRCSRAFQRSSGGQSCVSCQRVR